MFRLTAGNRPASRSRGATGRRARLKSGDYLGSNPNGTTTLSREGQSLAGQGRRSGVTPTKSPQRLSLVELILKDASSVKVGRKETERTDHFESPPSVLKRVGFLIHAGGKLWCPCLTVRRNLEAWFESASTTVRLLVRMVQ